MTDTPYLAVESDAVMAFIGENQASVLTSSIASLEASSLEDLPRTVHAVHGSLGSYQLHSAHEHIAALAQILADPNTSSAAALSARSRPWLLFARRCPRTRADRSTRMSETILVIDDAADVRALLAVALKEAGYRVVEADNGPAGIASYHAHQPDLILLDIGLGSMDGLEVCRQLRAVTSAPIIFLTARSDEVDQLVGFAAGGDDYVTKPFSAKVVVARINSLLRRQQRPDADSEDEVRGWARFVDTQSRVALLDGEPIHLTRTEFDLLTTMMENPDRVCTREMLLERVWGEWFGDTHVVEVHMSRLRNKITAAGGPKVGAVVRGVG